MFQFLFKYPGPVFTKGRFVLLSSWPAWLLVLLTLAAAIGLGLLIRRKLRNAPPELRNWRAWVIWCMQSALVALVLFLLWQPAILVSELNSQQNIIAVVVDDSRSMSIADAGGKTREDAALSALQNGLLAGLQKRFQTRIYRLGNTLSRVEAPQNITPVEPATHLSDGLQQLTAETADLPVGAVLLLSDGGQNTDGNAGSGISLDALHALHNRRLPVHTIGFGELQHAHDLEMQDVGIAPSAIANARVSATVTLTQRGYSGRTANLSVRDGDKLLAQRQITLIADGRLQTEQLFFPIGDAGAKRLTFAVEPLPGEENLANNAMTRPIFVTDTKRRILYVEGEPRWEYKFIRRAEGDDPTVQLVSMLRTSENKIYRQGISSPAELADGFPVRPEDLFGYSGIIIGSVDANYFTRLQQELLREYVDRRGGGLLFLGGRSSLSDGGWSASGLNDLLPTFLPAGAHNFHRNSATVELTQAGMDSPITQILDDPEKNAQRWKKLTYLADYEDAGSPKPGATVLADLHAGRRTLPLLITQTYGHGRTAILATGGTWRWQMSEALGDPSHDLFWQQLLRWLVAESPGPVAASMPRRLLMDEGHVQLTAQIRDHQFQPAVNARVSAHIVGPDNLDALVDLRPSDSTPGLYQSEWTAEKPGAYLAEISAESAASQPPELGRDVVTFQREDGVAENFHTEQNRALLEQLASETGGRYWTPSDVKNLPRDISYSEAGISVRSTKELWDMPIVFFVLLGLPAAEWLLRRKWGVI
ncbi:MAG TPA: glutamine amidotransferase [Candidatus Eremiobacteraceae bacterium]|nr:glutamine amidotransferase [Candidatus Eremiobacteraceae bacterium]